MKISIFLLIVIILSGVVISEKTDDDVISLTSEASLLALTKSNPYVMVKFFAPVYNFNKNICFKLPIKKKKNFLT